MGSMLWKLLGLVAIGASFAALGAAYFFEMVFIGMKHWGPQGPYCDEGGCTTPGYATDMQHLDILFGVIVLVWVGVVARILWLLFRPVRRSPDTAATN